jgi:hypothetical protein
MVLLFYNILNEIEDELKKKLYVEFNSIFITLNLSIFMNYTFHITIYILFFQQKNKLLLIAMKKIHLILILILSVLKTIFS